MSAIWDDLQGAFEEAFDAKREIFGEDLCDLLQTGTTDDGSGTGAKKPSETVVAQNVPCLYEEISGSTAQIVVNGVSVVATHRIEIKRSSAGLSLTPHDQIKVLARTGKPQLIFEQPVRTEGTFTPTIEFKAILVKEGYRQPAII